MITSDIVTLKMDPSPDKHLGILRFLHAPNGAVSTTSLKGQEGLKSFIGMERVISQ